jgi:hypothetical protein
MWSNTDETKTNARKIHGKCSQMQTERQQTPGKYTANVVAHSQNDNKRRRNNTANVVTHSQNNNKRRKDTRQMWSNTAETTTNASYSKVIQ